MASMSVISGSRWKAESAGVLTFFPPKKSLYSDTKLGGRLRPDRKPLGEDTATAVAVPMTTRMPKERILELKKRMSSWNC